MLLYKYKSLNNLWHVLDIVLNQRLYCAHWTKLNDPLEGRYTIAFIDGNRSTEPSMRQKIEDAKNTVRIGCLSGDPWNYLLWSHYADGHKGVAIELDIPKSYSYLEKVTYSPFDSIFVDKVEDSDDMLHIFNSKTEEWSYEEEYRLLYKGEFCPLPNPVRRILVGPSVSPDKVSVLRRILNNSVTVAETELYGNLAQIREKP